MSVETRKERPQERGQECSLTASPLLPSWDGWLPDEEPCVQNEVPGDIQNLGRREEREGDSSTQGRWGRVEGWGFLMEVCEVLAAETGQTHEATLGHYPGCHLWVSATSLQPPTLRQRGTAATLPIGEEATWVPFPGCL